MSETEHSACFTLREFCNAHRISRATFYNLLNRGTAPKVMRVGRKVMVSREAATNWRRELEARASGE
jgi:predicted DNA-binding transcriptional regulator AlpA